MNHDDNYAEPKSTAASRIATRALPSVGRIAAPEATTDCRRRRPSRHARWSAPLSWMLGVASAAMLTQAHAGYPETVAASAGRSHACAVLEDGTAHCWGANTVGQLGDGTTLPRDQPTPVAGLGTGVLAVAAGDRHSCAIRDNGSVWCWGYNAYGQLGDGTRESRMSPTLVAGLVEPATALALGTAHSCALTQSGAVACWGRNEFGEAGDGTTQLRTSPVAVSGLAASSTVIAAGSAFSCARLVDGRAQCWGRNDAGQLGDGSQVHSASPVIVDGLTGVTALTAGFSHACALRSGGGASCWGGNSFGQLGNNATGYSDSTPQPVVGLSESLTAIASSANAMHTCALTASGGVWCWGVGQDHRLGHGNTYNSVVPAAVLGIQSRASGLFVGDATSCAALERGGIVCWGSNRDFQIGNARAPLHKTPALVAELPSSAVSVAVGHRHSCALTATGSVACWGDNARGQLGDGTLLPRSTPGPEVGLAGAAAHLVAGDLHTCTLLVSGGVACWGNNWHGQLGDGSQRNERSLPVAVAGFSSGVSAIAAGASHTCALDAAGAVHCWGHNAFGQLGDGIRIDRPSPTGVIGLPAPASAITAADQHSCAVTTDQALHCWGANLNWQLGIPSGGGDYSSPRPVAGLDAGVAQAATSATHTCVLTTTGGVRCLGSNAAGQLGNGSLVASQSPVDVVGLSSGAVAVTVGARHSCALLAAGTVKCWGDFPAATETTSSPIPVPVADLPADVVALASRHAHTCAVGGNGEIACWGYNEDRQLGNGYRPVESAPTAVAFAWSNVAPVASDGALTVSSGSSATGLMIASDADGDGLDFSILSPPGNGSAVVLDSVAGSFRYTPATGFVGSDSFAFKASDGTSDSNIANVLITVNAAPEDPPDPRPIANPDAYVVAENGVLNVAAPGLLGNDVVASSATIRIEPSAAPAQGELTLGPDGGFTYAPKRRFVGLDTFAYRLCDAHDRCSTAAVSVTVARENRAPVARPDRYEAVGDGPLSVAAPGVLGNDEDLERDRLVSLIAEPPEVGHLILRANGAFEYTAPAGFAGDVVFSYRACDLSDACSTARVLIVVPPVRTEPVAYRLPMVAPLDDADRQGFIRVVNLSPHAGGVSLQGIDEDGQRSEGRVEFDLGPRAAAHLNALDLQTGNAAKGVRGALGSGRGAWTLEIQSTLDLALQSLVRTPSGFLTSIHDQVAGNGAEWWVPVFNPADNVNQVSLLRLINRDDTPAIVSIEGVDDAGATAGPVDVTIAPMATIELSARDLEWGNLEKGVVGRLGDGSGKWHLRLRTSAAVDAINLLRDPNGYLSNLSTEPSHQEDPSTGVTRWLWRVPASTSAQQGFVRLTNLSAEAGAVLIEGFDDAGARAAGHVRMDLNPHESHQLTAQDLERGNADKGLVGNLGPGAGNWRLGITSALDLRAQSYVRTPAGFLTSMNDLAQDRSVEWFVPIFNPASNRNQISVLRLVNPGEADISVEISAIDDAGEPSPSAFVDVRAGSAIEFTAAELEEGRPERGLIGRLGDGEGKWRLRIGATGEVRVMSLLRDPNGYLTNLSTHSQSGERP